MAVIMHYMKPSQKAKKINLKEVVEDILNRYFDDLLLANKKDMPIDLFESVTSEAEKTLLEFMMDYFNHNQSKISEILGINRSSLRKRLEQYNLI